MTEPQITGERRQQFAGLLRGLVRLQKPHVDAMEPHRKMVSSIQETIDELGEALGFVEDQFAWCEGCGLPLFEGEYGSDGETTSCFEGGPCFSKFALDDED